MDANLKKELKHYDKQKARAQDKGDLEQEAKVCSAVAELFAQNGLYENAIKEHKRALQIWDAKQDAIGSAVSHRMVGECLCVLGHYKQALGHQNKHLQLAKSCDNTVEQQRAWATIGRTWFVYSDSAVDATQMEECLIEAQKAYLESLSCCDELQGSVSDTELLEMKSRLYLNLGLVYDSKSDTSSARKFINEALSIAREQNLLETEFRCHYCIGGVLTKVGLDNEATNAYEKAVQVARKNGLTFDEADALVQLGQVYIKLGEFLSARRTLKKAYKISQSRAGSEIEGLRPNLVAAIKGLKLITKLNEGKENEQVKVLEALGDLYSNMKAFKKALECYNKELDLAKSIGLSASKLSPIFVSLAMTYSDLGLPDNAIKCYMEELRNIQGNYRGMCDTWCNMAQVYEIASYSYEDVEKAYFSALEYAEKANNVPVQIRVRKCLADSQKKYGKMNRYQETMEKIEKLESEFGMDEESEDDKEECEGSVESEDDDDDVIINREMDMSDTDDEDEDSETREAVTRRAARTKLSKKNEKGETPLHRAAIAGDAYLVGTLVDKGADITARDYCGWQPLHEACNHGHLEVARVLLGKGANVNDPGGAHCQGVTPLHDAAQNGHIDIVKLLLQYGASLLSKDVKGNTPLDLVIVARKTEDDVDGDETDESAGRREVEQYLRRFATGKCSNNDAVVPPEMRRRNRLFIEDKDIDNNDDDDDDGDDLGIPSLSQFNDRLQKRENKRTKIRRHASVDSDHGAVSDSSSPSKEVESTQRTSLERASHSLNSDDSEDSASMHHDSDDSTAQQHREPVSNRTVQSVSGQRDGTSIPHSRVPSTNSSNSFVDPIHGRHTGSKSSVPALIAEGDFEYTLGAKGYGETHWLVDDMAARPHKRRRTTPKQATLDKSLQLSRKRPSAFANRTSRSRSTSALTRTPKQPSNQPRLEVIRTPSPTFLSSSDTSSLGYHDNDLSIHAPSQPRGSSGPLREITTGTTPPMRVRVQIQGKTLLIPCPCSSGERKTIAWLAEQTKLRYFTAYGMNPVIVLQTNEGAYLSPEDNISDVLSNNEQIVASLESWDLRPLAERYKTACLSNNCKVKKEVLTLLQADPQISVISLSNLALRSSDVLPLARALKCHDRLVKLMIPGNRIGDSGLHHIACSLYTLPNLAALDLRSNGLTHKGITHFANSISKSADQQEMNAPLKLEELNLAFNALTDTCASSLASIMTTCPHLNTLQLQSACLSGKVVEPGKPLAAAIKASRLRHFSISHNPIGAHGIQDLLLALPCDVTHHLDLSSTGLDKNTVALAMEGIVDYMNKEGCAMQTFILADCSLTSKDVISLASTRCLKSVLRTLDISCNVIESDSENNLSRSLAESATLSTLNLQGNRALDMEFLESILQCLISHRNSVLCKLNLSSCGLTSPIADNLLKLLEQSCLPLVHLDLSFCGMEADDIRSLTAAWRRNGDRIEIVRGAYFLLCTTQN